MDCALGHSMSFSLLLKSCAVAARFLGRKIQIRLLSPAPTPAILWFLNYDASLDDLYSGICAIKKITFTSRSKIGMKDKFDLDILFRSY